MCTQWRLRSAWATALKLGSLATQLVHSEDSDRTGQPPRLIRVFPSAQWLAKDPRFLHADSEDSDQTGRMPRLIWVFAGRTLILLVLSCRTSFFGCLKFFTVCFTFIQLIRIAILTNKTEVKLKGLKKSVKQKRKKKRTHTCTCNEQFYTTFEILISIINYMW